MRRRGRTQLMQSGATPVQELRKILRDALTRQERCMLRDRLRSGARVLCGDRSYLFATPRGEYALEALADLGRPRRIVETPGRVYVPIPWLERFKRLCQASEYLVPPWPHHKTYTGPTWRYTRLIQSFEAVHIRLASELAVR